MARSLGPRYVDGMTAWPADPPAQGTTVRVERPGGVYDIRAVDGLYLVRWNSGLGSHIEHNGELFDIVISDGKNGDTRAGLTWAEVGALHP
jgi:hypothetical protein